MIKGFACGVFDLFHAGHVLMLMECKNYCDYLVVGVNKANKFDPLINPEKSSPIFSFENRILILQSCKFVDEVIGYASEKELISIMTHGKFQIRFLGQDYQDKAITAPKAINKIHYTDRSHGLSTTRYKNMVRGING